MPNSAQDKRFVKVELTTLALLEKPIKSFYEPIKISKRLLSWIIRSTLYCSFKRLFLFIYFCFASNGRNISKNKVWKLVLDIMLITKLSLIMTVTNYQKKQSKVICLSFKTQCFLR